MPVTFTEQGGLRFTLGGDKPTAELRGRVDGTTDWQEASACVEAATVPRVGVLFRQDWTLDEEEGDEAAGWLVTVRYAKREPDNSETVEVSIEIGGQTAHITQSFGTTRYAAPGSVAPDYGGAIGVNSSGGSLSVEGTDVYVPTYSWTESHRFPVSQISDAYLAGVYALCAAPVNGAPWRGNPPGAVLFRGARGSWKDSDEYARIEFAFSLTPNVTLSLGTISGIQKPGWDHLWQVFEEADDATAKSLVKRLKAAYVEQVYRRGDFSVLGIG